jgi:hypothetical protein
VLKVVPEMRFGITGAKTRAWFEIRPLGCHESAGSNLARSNEPLLSLPNQAGAASRHVDQIHLSLFTADCVPVQQRIAISAVNPSRGGKSDPIFILWLLELETETRAIDQF